MSRRRRYSEWKRKQYRKREARRRAYENRIIRLVTAKLTGVDADTDEGSTVAELMGRIRLRWELKVPKPSNYVTIKGIIS